MQFERLARPPVGVIYDFDAGNSVDGALALAMLYGFEGKGQARLLSTSTSRSSLRSAAFCEALGKFFSSPPPQPPAGTPADVPAGAPAGFVFQRPAPPIGMADSGKLAEDTPVIKAVLEKKTADGQPVYPYTIHKFNDTADPAALIRNAMTAQYDGNCVVVLAGPATNVVKALDLPDTAGWIKRKVKFLCVAASSFPDGRADSSITGDIASARRLFATWPGPIVAAGAEVGAALPFPGASIEKDFAWAPNHPIVDAYRAFQTMPYDAPARAMAAMLYAVHPDAWFKLSEPGTIAVLADGRTTFTPSPEGRHRYLLVDPEQKDKIVRTFVEMASAKPVPRPRFRPGQNQQVPPPKLPDPPEKSADPSPHQ